MRDLQAVRLLERSDVRYRLSNLVFQLGMRASVERSLLEVATPFLEDLYERTHETVHLGVLDDDAVVYVAKIAGHGQVASPSRVGARMPLHCTALGKVLLAHQPVELLHTLVERGLTRRTARTIVAPGLLAALLERMIRRGEPVAAREEHRNEECR